MWSTATWLCVPNTAASQILSSSRWHLGAAWWSFSTPTGISVLRYHLRVQSFAFSQQDVDHTSLLIPYSSSFTANLMILKVSSSALHNPNPNERKVYYVKIFTESIWVPIKRWSQWRWSCACYICSRYSACVLISFVMFLHLQNNPYIDLYPCL